MDKVRKKFLLLLCMGAVLILTACGHQHTWQEATCITPKTCAECGETEGEALGHKWSAATCEEPEICSVCGATQGEANGHVWEKATCQHPERCSICGSTRNSTLGDHECSTWSEIVDSTCTEVGFKKGTCVNCGQEFTVVLDKIPHDFDGWEITKQTSCAEPGEQKHICTRCGYEEIEEIAPVAHDLDEWKVTKEATYNENGLKEQKCRTCKNTINSEEFSFADLIKEKVELKNEISGVTVTDANILVRNSYGYVTGQVIIEITNNSDSSIKITKTNVDIVDNDGALLETVKDYNVNLAPAIIEAGQKGYILAELHEGKDELDISNGVDVKAYITAEKTQDFRSHWEFTDVKTKGNNPETVGHIRNADNKIYGGYVVYCMYKDKTGRVIGYTDAYGNDEIAPDEMESFGTYNSCYGLIKANDIEEVECIAVGYLS